MKLRSPASIIKLVILVAFIVFLALQYVEEFEFVKNTNPDTGLDKRAVEVLRGPITHVRDGDTIEVNRRPIRIAALDCPENSTSEGQKATRFAKQFKAKQSVCELTGAKTYDREVGYLSIIGKDFAWTMIENKSYEFWCKWDVWGQYC